MVVHVIRDMNEDGYFQEMGEWRNHQINYEVSASVHGVALGPTRTHPKVVAKVDCRKRVEYFSSIKNGDAISPSGTGILYILMDNALLLSNG
jgi:hypothetical protein